MSNPATPSDVAAKWRPLTSAETEQAFARLDEAWNAILLAKRPTLEADIAAGAVLAATARMVVTEMVLRVMKNPDGKSEESVDDYRYRRDASISAGALYVTPEELALLTPAATLAARRSSVRLVAYGEL